MRSLWIALSSRVLWVGLGAALLFSAALTRLSTIAATADAGSAAWLISNPRAYATPLASAAVTVFATGFLGGILKVILDVISLERESRASRLRFLQNTLDDVKAVEDRLQRTRLVILAHRSAKTYGDEMRDLIEARVKVMNIERAYRLTAFDFPEAFKSRITSSCKKMITSFDALINEFHKEYKDLADLQLVCESALKKALSDGPDLDEGMQEAKKRDALIWTRLCKLNELKLFLPQEQDIRESESYEARFGCHVDNITKELRFAMQKTLEGRDKVLARRSFGCSPLSRSRAARSR
jgi:hypothetical protein